MLVVGIMLPGCRNASSGQAEDKAKSTDSSVLPAEIGSENENENDLTQTATELVFRFGDEGEPFSMHLYDNNTAAAIASHLGTSDWRLPIYHYDDYENWEVMQYYDIPDRYVLEGWGNKIVQISDGE